MLTPEELDVQRTKLLLLGYQLVCYKVASDDKLPWMIQYAGADPTRPYDALQTLSPIGFFGTPEAALKAFWEWRGYGEKLPEITDE